jgi:acetyltransferase-like isoleucine patch superfamily enzyme
MSQFAKNLKRLVKDAASLARRERIDRMGLNCEFTGTISRRMGGGLVQIGDDSQVGANIVCNLPTAEVTIGRRTFIGAGVLLDSAARISIGDDVLIAYQVVLSDHDSHSLYWPHRQDDVVRWRRGEKDWTHVERGPIVIGPRCWIGMRAIVLKRVQLGEGCVVAAGSVVTKSYPAYSLIAGNPGRLIRRIEPGLGEALVRQAHVG